MALRIGHLRHAALFVPSPAEAADFYERIWGLRIADDDEGTAFLRAGIDEPYVLALHPAEQRGIHHLAFAMESAQAVDDAAEELRSTGVTVLEAPHHLDAPGGGYGLRLLDPDDRVIELSAELDPAGPPTWTAPVVPRKISHTVLNTPDIDRVTAFYTDVLGFRVSDWSEHQMVFLRCSPDHHSVAFNQAPHASLNHIAYEVPGMEDVMRGLGNFRRQGRTQMWGPGRHGPGNMVFCYFQDPSAFVCEYTAEVMRVDDATWQPRVWQRTPELMDRWGTAGMPTPEARVAMQGEPDPAFLARASLVTDAGG